MKNSFPKLLRRAAMIRHALRVLIQTAYVHDEDERNDEIAQIPQRTDLELIDLIACYDDNFAMLDDDEVFDYRKRLQIVAQIHNYHITDDDIAALDDATFH